MLNAAINKNIKVASNQEHPGAPWFHWCPDSRHPGYWVIPQGRTIQCSYIRYSIYNGVPYEMGTEGLRRPQFARAMYATPKLPVEAGVEDHDLNPFVHNCPFNFAFEQALQHVSDPGMLAEVARLRTLVARIPIYSKLA